MFNWKNTEMRKNFSVSSVKMAEMKLGLGNSCLLA